MLPRQIVNFNCFVDGINYVGKAKMLMLPTITKKTRDVKNSNMAATVKVATGYEPLEAEVTFEEAVPDLVKLMKKNGASAFNIRFVGTFYDPGNSNKSSDVEVKLTGYFTEFAPGEYKADEQPETKFKISATYYSYTDDGEELLAINALEPFTGTE